MPKAECQHSNQGTDRSHPHYLAQRHHPRRLVQRTHSKSSQERKPAELRQLLSIPSKIFCKILLSRIERAIDAVLRDEQAGFRKGRGCTDQIFALRNIIEQCLEWNTALCINFIDFRKAFDSIHRDSLWTILRSYGIPPKIVELISMF